MLAKLVRVPGLAAVLRDLAIARTTQVLGALLSNGVGLLRALDISRATAGHPELEHAMTEARDAVKAGQRLGDSLGDSAVLPEDVVEMIDVAEAANSLPKVLADVAQITQQRVDRRLDMLLRFRVVPHHYIWH